jgi:secretion/DNA translocation related TadE-like protein
VVTAVALLVAAVLVGAVVTDLLAARRRASTAADLGALGAAPIAPQSESEACGVADRLARENGARLTQCRVVDGDVQVTVAARPRGPWAVWLDTLAGGPVVVRVTGRAGLR